MSKNLINKSAVREYLLDRCHTTRLGWDCRQVSSKAIDELEGIFRHMLNKAVHAHPTIGKTFKEVM